MTGNETDSEPTWEEVLDPEMKAVVPKFWLQFSPPPMYLQYLLGILYTIIMTVGLAGNITIIWLFATTKRLRKPSNYLVINLAFSDVLMLGKMVVFIYNSFSGGPAAGPRWCTFYGLLGGLSGTSAIMTITMMSVERYVCVSRPLDPSCKMTRIRAVIMVISIWIYAAIFSFLPLFGINQYVPEGYLTSCSFDYLSDDLTNRVFVLSFFVAAWCIPMIVICRCYIGIVLCVCESEQVFRRHSQNVSIPDRNVQNQKKLEIKLAKISFSLISLWTVAWTPYAFVALLGIFSDRSMLTPLTSMLPALFCKTASVLDPFIYGLSNQTFKNEFFRKLVSLCKSRKLRNKDQLPSFIRRAISVRSHERSSSDPNAEISISEEEQGETTFTYYPRRLESTKLSENNKAAKAPDMNNSVKKTENNNGVKVRKSEDGIKLQKVDYDVKMQETSAGTSISQIKEIATDLEAQNGVLPELNKDFKTLEITNVVKVPETLNNELPEFNDLAKASDNNYNFKDDSVSGTTQADSGKNVKEKGILFCQLSAPLRNSNTLDDIKHCYENSDNDSVLKSMRIFNIPRVYLIEAQNDVIKIRTKRSF